jgi:hypothetical protein
MIVYKEIPNFPAYRAGSDGTVWSRFRLGRQPRSGPVYADWHLKKTQPSPDGYRRLQISNSEGRRWATVGELILEAHTGPRPPGQLVRHLDRNKVNNAATNLAWGTYLENERDKIGHGTSNHGERNPMSRLRADQVREIKALLGTIPQKDIATRFGICSAQVSHIKYGRQWASVF